MARALEDIHQRGEVSELLEHRGGHRGAVDAVPASDDVVLGLQVSAGAEQEAAGVVHHIPEHLPGPDVYGPPALGREDHVPRHRDHGVVPGRDVNTEPLTLPVVQSEIELLKWKYKIWQKLFAADRIRTCAGRPHLISSQTP